MSQYRSLQRRPFWRNFKHAHVGVDGPSVSLTCFFSLRPCVHLTLTSLYFSLRLFQKTFPERLKQLTLGLTPEHVSVPRVDPSSPTRLLEEGSDRPESIVLTPDPADLDIRLTIGLPSEGERAGEEEEAEDVEGLSPDYLTGRELEDEEEDEAPSCNGSTAGYEKRINATVQLAQDETLQGYRWRSSGENE